MSCALNRQQPMAEPAGASVDPTHWLRRRVADPGQAPLLLPGVPNALTARICEEAGFEAVYLSGAGLTNTLLGAPDIGLLTMTELAGQVAAIRDAVRLPIVVDADVGFGNAINVQRTVRALERAGASAIQLEDQVLPKRCGHFNGKAVISAEEMVGKIRAALDARTHPDLLIVARTDARAGHGLDEACDRAGRYLAAGADVAFVEAPLDLSELEAITTRLRGPLLVNVVEGGMSPALSLAEAAEMGFDIILYANTLMRAAITAMQRAAASLRQTGETTSLLDDMASWTERQRLVRKPEFDRLGERYAPGGRDQASS
jgi:2-methylisocitrate lyase-like PEP mutase family enzyme